VSKLNEQETARLICMATAAFPLKKELTEEQQDDLITVWRMVLNDIPYKIAEASLIKVLSTSKYFPAVAEIREAAINLMPGPPTAEEAWNEVRRVITSGHLSIDYQYNGFQPKWNHKLLEKTVREIGLREMFESENMNIMMAQFKNAYNKNLEGYWEAKLNQSVLRVTMANVHQLATNSG
jgi:hypothetical protein